MLRMEPEFVKQVFVFGIGRSGTTLLSRLAALSCTPMRFINEPITCLHDAIAPDKVDTNFIAPNERERIAKMREIIPFMEHETAIFEPKMRLKIERDNPDAKCLLLKEVHALLAFPQVLAGLDCRIVVITRETSRVLDSYLLVEGNFAYLVEEFGFLADYVSGRITERYPTIDAALASVSPSVVRYLKRPKWLTSRLRRTVCTMEVIRHFLLAWAEKDERVLAIQYEDLCRQPIPKMMSVFSFLGLDYDARTERQIVEMTSGQSTEYYATDKDSRLLLDQAYRKLMPSDLRWMGRFVTNHIANRDNS